MSPQDDWIALHKVKTIWTWDFTFFWFLTVTTNSGVPTVFLSCSPFCQIKILCIDINAETENIFASHLHNNSQAHDFSSITEFLYLLQFTPFLPSISPDDLQKQMSKKSHVMSSNDSPCWPDDPYRDYLSRIQHDHIYFHSPKEDPVSKNAKFFPHSI